MRSSPCGGCAAPRSVRAPGHGAWLTPSRFAADRARVMGLAELSVDARRRLTFEVQEFLFHEASLLDERRYQDWLALLTEDVHYWMPIRRTTTGAVTCGPRWTPPPGSGSSSNSRRKAERKASCTASRASSSFGR